MIAKLFTISRQDDDAHVQRPLIRIVASDFGEAEAKYRRFAKSGEPAEIARIWGGPIDKFDEEPGSIRFVGIVIL